jgi:hypothetical protein
MRTSSSMTTDSRPPARRKDQTMDSHVTSEGPLLVEDLLLLLFDPRSGTFAGEGTLFYTLAGAMLTDLAMQGRIEIVDRPALLGPKARAVGDSPPADDLLREVWGQLRGKPKGVQGLLAGVGPNLRAPVLERLVRGGHVARRRRMVLGLFSTTRLIDGGSDRRRELLGAVRPVLVDGIDSLPRTAVLAALLSASGSLPTLHRDIPWSGDVYTRGKELERGDCGAAAAGEAVMRTALATSLSTLSVATAAGR